MIAAIGILSCGVLITSLGSAELRAALLIVALGAAGALAERWIRDRAQITGGDAVDAALVAVCLALMLVLVSGGIVHLVSGPVQPGWLIAALAGTIALLGVLPRQIKASPWHISRLTLAHLVVLLLLSVPLRMVSLGYSEFQGDEARVLLRSAAMAQGFEAAPLVHHKGPGELVLAMSWGTIVGRVSESDARLPFALAGVLCTVALYAAGRVLFNPAAGLIAASLWAINGYAVAFSRIVQYHNLVVLLTLVALMTAWRLYRSERTEPLARMLPLAFLIAALACGFNTPILGLPAGILLVMATWPRLSAFSRLPRLRLFVIAGAVSAGLLAALAAVFGGPWQELLRYAGERLGRGQPHNNFDLFAGVSVQYTSLPYLTLSVTLGALALCWLSARSSDHRRSRLGLSVGVVVGMVTLVITRGQPTWLGILVWLLALMQCLLIPRQLSPAWRVLALGAHLPLGMYLFLIGRPGTHWYELFPALLLFIGGFLAEIYQRWRPPARLLASAIGVATLAFVWLYPAQTFVPGWAPVDGIAFEGLFRPPMGTLRGGGTFGFPHYEGWKAVAALHEQELLARPYWTNQWMDVARWYVPNAEWCGNLAQSYMVALTATPPDRYPRGVTSWSVYRGQVARLVVVDSSPNPRAYAPVDVSTYEAWYDANRSTFERPLSVPVRYCPRPMPPSWDVYDVLGSE